MSVVVNDTSFLAAPTDWKKIIEDTMKEMTRDAFRLRVEELKREMAIKEQLRGRRGPA